MPENNNLPIIKPPMRIRFGEKPCTEFKNNLKAIQVTLKDGPNMGCLRDYAVDFSHATWSDDPLESSEEWRIESNLEARKKIDKLIYMIFKGLILPSTMETMKFTFLFEGISYQDVTHLLRYRTATFSAECSADKWWSHKDIVVPSSIENSPEFYKRFKQLQLASKQLYCDMIDSKKISLIDARGVLTRAYETFYWVSWDLKTCLSFIRDRIDKQIQPESDNVMAYLLYMELVGRFPLLAEIIDIHAPSQFYINTARTGRCTNLFVPDADSDSYEWNREDYLYQTERSEVNGTDDLEALTNRPFFDILERTDKFLERVKVENRILYGEDFFK